MSFNFFHGSIRKKMVSIVVLATLPVFILLIYNEVMEQRDRARSAERDVQIYLHGLSEIQRRITDSTKILLQTVVAMPEIKNRNKVDAKTILGTILKENPIYSNVIILDSKGDVLVMGDGENKGLNFADRKQFKDAMKTKRFSYGEFVIGKTSQKTIFPFAMPILDQTGEPEGAIIIGVDLNYYKKSFEQFRFPEGAFIGISDQNGTRLFRYPSTPDTTIGIPIKRRAFEAAKAAGMAGITSITSSDKINRIVAYEPLRINPEDTPYMYLFMGLDKDKLLSKAYNDMIKGIIISALSLLFALSLASLLGGRIIAVKVANLASMALKIGRGEAPPSQNEDYADGEIGQLFRSFGTMTSLLQKRECDLNQAKATVEDANKALRANMRNMRTLVETMPELVWLKDISGKYIFCNHKFERLFGATEAEIIGKSDYDFVDKDLANFFRKHDIAAMNAGEPIINEETVTYNDDGHIEDLETIKTPLFDDDGQLVGVLGVARDITDRKRIADELKESEMRFKALHNASFGGIAIHNHGIILDCNQGLSDISGYSTQELIGMDGILLIAEDSRELVMNNIVSGFEKQYEAFGLRKNGEQYPLQLEGKNIPYKGLMVRAVEFRDITDRKMAEEKLRDSESRHRIIFENSPLGIVRFSEHGEILDCNTQFSYLMGVDRNSLIGLNSVQYGSVQMRSALTIALAGELSFFEDYYTSEREGKPIYLHAVFNPIKVGQSPTEVIATLEDVSDRKQAQDELRAAKEQAENFSKSKTEFLTNMSHEIRTPLNGILGMLTLMQTTGLNHEQTEYILAAIHSSKRLTSLLTDILDLSRVEAGKMIVQHIPFDIPETLEQIFDLYKLISEQTGVELRSVVDPNIPRIVLGDPIRLQQILTNLVGNAYKFTDKGHIAVEAHLMPTTQQDRCRVLFSVSDTGTGIQDSQLDTLFNSFTQVSQGYTREHQGAGLGLAICKRLVHLMGGVLAIESEIGVGTTLYASIPFAVSSDPIQQKHSENELLEPHTCRLKILLAEDERVNSMVTRRLLEKAGHTVTCVENGKQALEGLKKQSYDVVLMDIQMPVMDGVEATRLIRLGEAGEQNLTIPIIAVTAYAMVGDKEGFMKSGMDGYVVKPIELEKLQEVLNHVHDCENIQEQERPS